MKKGRTSKRKAKGSKLSRMQKREVKAIVHRNIEDKSHDVAVVSVGIDHTTGVVVNLLTALARGTGGQAFIGDKFQPTSLDIRFNLINGGADATNMVRCVVIQNKGNAGVPTAANVWQSVANVRAPLSAFELDFDDTYRVLWDRIYNLNNNFGDNIQAIGRCRIFRKKMRMVSHDQAGAVEAHGLWMLFISDSAIAGHPMLQLYSRLKFEDA